MTRRLALLLLLLTAFAAPAVASCNLSMTVSCANGSCTATTTNNGGSCSGLVYSGWMSGEQTGGPTLSSPQVSLSGVSDCFDSDDFGMPLPFAFCYGETTIPAGKVYTSRVQVSGSTGNLFAMSWVGNDEGEEISSAYAFTNGPAAPTCVPNVSAPPISQSGLEYTVSWSAISDPTAQYIVEESTSADFSNNTTTSQVHGLSKVFRHDGMATSTTYYYRVRATHCGGSVPSYSAVAQTVVQAPAPAVVKTAEVAVPLGSDAPVGIPVFIPGPTDGSHTTFTAVTDQPYLTVTPSSGNLPAGGVTVIVTASPGSLPPGASTGTLIITTTSVSSASGVANHGSTIINIPVSISLVTPVMPGGKTLPPANALIVPAVAHANGAAGPFLSDVRLTNSGATPIDYQITMTPTRTDGTASSKVTQVTVEGDQTIALNDVVKNFFGYGALGNDGSFGSLEIRPLNTSSTLTYASSRTYASTAGGTFGQYIAAMPFTKFASKRFQGIPLPGQPQQPSGSTKLSLQQVAQSAKFRTNLGIVEGAGEPASGRIRIFDSLGSLLREVPFSLLAGEHRQMNMFISDPALGNIPQLDDGRIEILIDSPTGAVTAYASVLDSVTTDPLAVTPVDATKISARRYVIPGMAELPNRGNNFHSDLRVFNGGTADVPVTMTFYPMGRGTPIQAQPRIIRAGEVLVLDNVLPTAFNASETGGSIAIQTPVDSSLVVTGRTYTSVENGGSYGQFIPGVTPAEGTGLGEKALQVMQLEESGRFRSNVGLAELSGKSATVRLTLHLPDAKFTPSIDVELAPNEFTQLRPILGLNPGRQTYNARIEVQVVAGEGRVTAYGSVIDNESKDPTYVPAQ
ncbi:MAG TPA: hypothetical protein VGF28_03585 [Thermoanaerobaculia bacterium]|jgi:hypothetical protein